MPPAFRSSRRLVACPRGAELLETGKPLGAEFPGLEERAIRLDRLNPRRRNAGVAYPARRILTVLRSPRDVASPGFESTVAPSSPTSSRGPGRLRAPTGARGGWERWARTASRRAGEAIAARAAWGRNPLRRHEERFRDERRARGPSGAPDDLGGWSHTYYLPSRR